MKPNSTGKLNERNIVDIVQKLIGLGSIRLIHTQDGKEYLTPNQLSKEISDVVD